MTTGSAVCATRPSVVGGRAPVAAPYGENVKEDDVTLVSTREFLSALGERDRLGWRETELGKMAVVTKVGMGDIEATKGDVEEMGPEMAVPLPE